MSRLNLSLEVKIDKDNLIEGDLLHKMFARKMIQIPYGFWQMLGNACSIDTVLGAMLGEMPRSVRGVLQLNQGILLHMKAPKAEPEVMLFLHESYKLIRLD